MTEVAGRLGVSIHSLYEWGKAASPNKEEKRCDEIERPPSIRRKYFDARHTAESRPNFALC